MTAGQARSLRRVIRRRRGRRRRRLDDRLDRWARRLRHEDRPAHGPHHPHLPEPRKQDESDVRHRCDTQCRLGHRRQYGVRHDRSMTLDRGIRRGQGRDDQCECAAGARADVPPTDKPPAPCIEGRLRSCALGRTKIAGVKSGFESRRSRSVYSRFKPVRPRPTRSADRGFAPRSARSRVLRSPAEPHARTPG